MAKYDKGQFSGIGTDLFIKKNSPGHHIGEGYTIEIFLNGVKQEEIYKKNKSAVIDFIKEQKSKYNTNRSFENASQLHITYKTKEERGEGSSEDSNSNKQPEGDHMAAIDNTLLKQASDIENLISRLISPDMPIKVRMAADEILNTNDMPDPSPDMREMPVTPESVAQMLTDKVIAYVQSKPDIQVDELYNSIKHWISEVKKKLNEYESSSNQKIDRKQIIDIFKQNMQSNDNGLSPELNSRVQEVLSKKASTEEPTETSFDSLHKVTEKVNTNPEDPRNYSVVKTTIKNIDEDKLEKEMSELDSKDKNFAESIVTDIIKDIEKDLKRASIYYNMMQKEKTAFFKYASTVKGTRSLESVFNEHLASSDLTFEDAQFLWDKVQEDINGDDKYAAMQSDILSFVFPEKTISKKAWVKLDALNTEALYDTFNEDPNLLNLAQIWASSQQDGADTSAGLRAVVTAREVLNNMYPRLFDVFEKLSIDEGKADDPNAYADWLRQNLGSVSALATVLNRKLGNYFVKQIPDVNIKPFVDAIIDQDALSTALNNSYGGAQLQAIK